MPLHRLIPVLAAAALATADSASAQDYRDVVVRQLDASSQAVAQHGFRADPITISRDQLIGLLPANSMMMLELDLVSGASYFIVGACDHDCGDMNLELYAGGESVDRDIADDDVPMLEFTAARTGHHMLAVRMVKCRTNNCYFGVRVFRK